MNFHEPYIPDPRRRFYRPVQRILAAERADDAEQLIGNTRFQNVIHYLPKMTTLRSGGMLLLDFGSSFHGGILVNPYSPDAVIRVQFGESVSECLGDSNQDCTRKNALLELPNYGQFEYGNTVFRFVRIVNESAHEICFQNIMGVVLERDMPLSGSFESSDELLNRIWKTAVRTVHLCMQHYLYDGAKRDRIAWMGDMHPEIKTILCAFSDTSVIRDSLAFLIRQAPADRPMNNIYTYSCWFIISLWDYLCATGDAGFIRRNAEYIKLMLETYCAFITDEGAECIPERRFLDWPNDAVIAAKHAGIHALLVWMMGSGEKLLNFLGMDSSPVAEAQAKLRKHIPDPTGRKAPAALLTLTGLADRRDVLEKNPLEGISTFYGYYMLLAKETGPALNLIRRYWGGMLNLGATSFWEDFDLKWAENAFGIDSLPVPGKKDIHADFGQYCYQGLRHSLSHGWSSGPAPFLSQRILGVSFPEPGKVTIRPDLGDLEYVRGSVPSSCGLIQVEAGRSGNLNIDVPPGLMLVESGKEFL